uniref:Uncharacterized protein n=1 Tax=Cacopsylla melanoneura TaxID=428564 RepID=A0A8D8WF76_9HEMI
MKEKDATCVMFVDQISLPSIICQITKESTILNPRKYTNVRNVIASFLQDLLSVTTSIKFMKRRVGSVPLVAKYWQHMIGIIYESMRKNRNTFVKLVGKDSTVLNI